MDESSSKSSPYLPVEVIEQIVPEIEHHRDLVNFACTSHIWKHLIIPRHTEYRVLRVGNIDSYAHVWAHLARRPDLACNFREIVIEQVDSDHPREPTSLIEDEDRQKRSPEVRQDEILRSLRYMYRLTSFTWDHRSVTYPRPNQLHRWLAPSVFDVLHEVGSIKKFCLIIVDQFKFNEPMEGCGLWKLSSLRALKIIAEKYRRDWDAKPKLVSTWFNSLSSLEFLYLPVHILHQSCASVRFPCLKKFKIYAWTADTEEINSIVYFLEQHPQLEELKWYSHEDLAIPPFPANFLPNIRNLDCHKSVFRCMIAQSEIGVSPPRKLEGLSISDWGAYSIFDQLCVTQGMDHGSLRRFTESGA